MLANGTQLKGKDLATVVLSLPPWEFAFLRTPFERPALVPRTRATLAPGNRPCREREGIALRCAGEFSLSRQADFTMTAAYITDDGSLT